MKRWMVCALLALAVTSISAQQATNTSDPYKPTLDRLESLTSSAIARLAISC